MGRTILADQPTEQETAVGLTADEMQAFQLFKEIGIIHQLASTELGRVLPDGLHITHFSLLDHLATCTGGQTPQQMAEAFQMSKQNMTHAVAQLQKRALVKVGPHPRDGRSKLVTITDTGREFRLAAINALKPVLSDLVGQPTLKGLGAQVLSLNALRLFLDERRNSASA
jgi:DNA-binding MarR family transcriptional regulator